MDAKGFAGLSTIGQIAVPIEAQKRAVAFYRDVLGLPFLFAVMNLAFFDCAGTRLLLDRKARGRFAESPGWYPRPSTCGFAAQSVIRIDGCELAEFGQACVQ